MNVWIPGAAALVCLLARWFYALAESAHLAVTPALLEDHLEAGQGDQLESLLEGRPARHLHCMVMGALCEAGFVCSVLLLSSQLGAPTGLAVTCALVACLLLSISGRVLLTAMAARDAARLYVKLRSPAAASRLALGLLTRPLRWAVFNAGRKEGTEGPPARPFNLPRDAVGDLVEQADAADPRLEMIENIVELGDGEAREVMTPRTKMVTISVDEPLSAAVDLALAKGHSRIPVFEGNRDNIIGVLYVKDLLRYWRQDEGELPGLRELMRQPVHVPESQPIGQLLGELQARTVHLAIVADEYGGTAGLVTIEDILEEIVGEITDEHDPDEASLMRRLSDDEAHVAAAAHVDDVNEALDIELPEDDELYDTIGGFVFAQLGHIPKRGERLTYNNVEIEILEADERRIHRLALRRTAV